MSTPPRKDEPASESRRGVEEIEIETGETIGRGPKVDPRESDVESPEIPEEDRVNLD